MDWREALEWWEPGPGHRSRPAGRLAPFARRLSGKRGADAGAGESGAAPPRPRAAGQETTRSASSHDGSQPEPRIAGHGGSALPSTGVVATGEPYVLDLDRSATVLGLTITHGQPRYGTLIRPGGGHPNDSTPARQAGLGWDHLWRAASSSGRCRCPAPTPVFTPGWASRSAPPPATARFRRGGGQGRHGKRHCSVTSRKWRSRPVTQPVIGKRGTGAGDGCASVPTPVVTKSGTGAPAGSTSGTWASCTVV